MSDDTCAPHHDFWGTLLTVGLIGGLFASYVPQHLRIVSKGSSEGFSPWFLLLGATSSAAGMLNMWTMQWGVVKCCRYLTAGQCAESLGGVIQVSLQWMLFVIIFVLYMLYYPSHLKYLITNNTAYDGTQGIKTNVRTNHWNTSIVLSWVVALHMLFCTFVTFFLLTSTRPPPQGSDGSEQNAQIAIWATFLGVTSAVLAAVQYYPQLLHTYRLKLVGALSIPMMVIQSPGAALMVVSIAMRPGTDWTSWIMFAVSGIMQCILLLMCIAWKIRQRRLHIDDFGHPLPLDSASYPVLREGDTGVAVPVAVNQAIEEQVYQGSEEMDEQSDTPDIEIVRAMIGEDTPLLKKATPKEANKTSWWWRFNN